jgi:hypothetical protein
MGSTEQKDIKIESPEPQQSVSAYEQGFIDGITAYAHSKDSQQEVGTTGKLLKKAIEEVKNTWNYSPPPQQEVNEEVVVEKKKLTHEEKKLLVEFDQWNAGIDQLDEYTVEDSIEFVDQFEAER